MSHHWDEFSKSLAEESLPRRESLRRLGAVFAGAILSPLGLGTAWAGPKNGDPCKAFCKCRNKSQQSQCIAACRDCDSDPRFLCGTCSGGYACTDLANDPWNCGACYHYCGDPGPYEYVACIDGLCKFECVSGAVRCDKSCTMFDSDEYNCGGCGNVCEEPGPYEYGWCENGQCQYECLEGAVICDGNCTDLFSDPNNCGECGHVCGGAAPVCFEGACRTCEELGGTYCDGECVSLVNNPNNCGACGVACGDGEDCVGGVCQSQDICIPDCGPGSTYGAAWCGDDGCGGRCPCTGEGEYCPSFSNWCAISQPTDF